ncbi:MAG: hypothetical protein VBE63_08410 [Lamprobacter sp.]|uniref:hypothetical protein n=1 Tax=Lamprobacter sp. TaxID=3100796 RepID=UPI002B2596BB|nr:hypothetical protein [Lamprobacter sp.]MEA3639952.1 hypothetical protein [Lamprobacter sp.]
MPAYLVGPPGMGKSDFLTDVLLAKLEAHFFPDAEPLETPLDLPAGMTSSPGGKVICITEILSTRDPMDIRGWQLFETNKETGHKESVYIMPDIAAKEQRAYKEFGAEIVVINFDELPQADTVTQKAACDTLLNGRLGDHKLSQRTWIVAAGNRQQDGAGATKLLSILNNRITTLEVYNPHEGYLKYLRSKEVPSIMVDYAEFAAQDFASAQPTKDGPFLTNRSYMAACQYVRTARKLEKITDPLIVPDNPAMWAAISGVIGSTQANSLKAFLASYKELPKPEEILRDPDNAKLPPQENIGAHYAASRMLISMVTATNVDALWRYAKRLRRELAVKTATEIGANPAVANVFFNCPTYSQWSLDPNNAALVRASLAKF